MDKIFPKHNITGNAKKERLTIKKEQKKFFIAGDKIKRDPQKNKCRYLF